MMEEKVLKKLYCKMKINDLDDKGTFTGYASVFNNVDLGDDVMLPGAFKRTIKNSGGVIPILSSHDMDKEIGITQSLKEDDYGLEVKGKLYISDDPKMDLPEARNKYIIMQNRKKVGKPMGQSIGYYTMKHRWDQEKPNIRFLEEVRLHEISLVSIPMNELATVTDAKSLENEIEKLFELAENYELFDDRQKKSILEKVEKLNALLGTSAVKDPDSATVKSILELAEQVKSTAQFYQIKRLTRRI